MACRTARQDKLALGGANWIGPQGEGPGQALAAVSRAISDQLTREKVALAWAEEEREEASRCLGKASDECNWMALSTISVAKMANQ